MLEVETDVCVYFMQILLFRSCKERRQNLAFFGDIIPLLKMKYSHNGR